MVACTCDVQSVWDGAAWAGALPEPKAASCFTPWPGFSQSLMQQYIPHKGWEGDWWTAQVALALMRPVGWRQEDPGVMTGDGYAWSAMLPVASESPDHEVP